jgi:peptide/nickel transport system permease protein
MRVLQDLRQLMRYPAAVVGLAIIGALIVVAIYTVITVPYSEVIRLWRGGGELWEESPRTAWPQWINLLPWENRPTTLIVCSTEVGEKTVRPLAEGISEVEILLPFDFTYNGFPREITVFFTAEYDERRPYVSLIWLTPDGREIRVGERTALRVYRMSIDGGLTRRLGGKPAHVGLFADPAAEELSLKGEYTLRVEGLLFEDDADLDARLVVYGQVHGLAGTDHMRRDLMVGLLWGIPVALAFGFLAAVGAQISTFVLAAIGVWYGKWVDGVFRWLTQVNIILPVDRHVLLAEHLGDTGGSYPAQYLQLILLCFTRHVPPDKGFTLHRGCQGIWSREFQDHLPLYDPQGHPGAPSTVCHDANAAIYNGHYYWMVQPGILLLAMGIGFAMVGYTLDRVFNPRLRQI